MPRYRYAIVEHTTYGYEIIALDPVMGEDQVYAVEGNFESEADAQAAAEALIAAAGEGE